VPARLPRVQLSVADAGGPAPAQDFRIAGGDRLLGCGRRSLDGGVGTEVSRAAGIPIDFDQGSWATRALAAAPRAVADVHRSYLEAGCDVISTNSWGLVAGGGEGASSPSARPLSWVELARRALDLAVTAVEDSGRGGECAVAFSLDSRIDSGDGREVIQLLARLFDDGPAPDLVLLETLTLLRPSLYRVVRELRDVGLPIWLSFRRCRHGLCGAYGEHPGGPEGDSFGHAARELEQIGIDALLVNCVPPDHIDGMVSYLRDFTDLPLGAYPNLGYLSDAGWRHDSSGEATDYGELALRWRAEGAQIASAIDVDGRPRIASMLWA
jgi:homocysteine S-methyltransferase